MEVEIKLYPNVKKSTYIDTIIRHNLVKYLQMHANRTRIKVTLDKMGLKLSFNSLVKEFIKATKFNVTEDCYIVSIDNDYIIKDTDHKLIDVISLIDRGNLNVRPSHLFDGAFEYIKDNLMKIIERKFI